MCSTSFTAFSTCCKKSLGDFEGTALPIADGWKAEDASSRLLLGPDEEISG